MFSIIRAALLTLTLCLPAGAFAADYRLETWAGGLDLPWSIAFLPDGSALVTELGGRLLHIDASGTPVTPVENVPPVYFAGQGGLFDVVLHPRFAENQLVYLSFAEGSRKDNGTAVVRGRLQGNALEDTEVIFRNFTRKDTAVHYGGRMAFLPDGSLLLTTGDGFDYREAAQDIDSGLGKVLRMNDDGTPALGNPFPGSPYVYSYGHRNPQGLAVSRSGTIWLHEHGPRGGDELNRIEPGVNYGWPAITYRRRLQRRGYFTVHGVGRNGPARTLLGSVDRAFGARRLRGGPFSRVAWRPVRGRVGQPGSQAAGF